MSKKKRSHKFSLQEYIDNGGVSCPFCGETGGVEGSQSFEHFGEEAHMDVVCSLCGEHYIEVYHFSFWENEEEKTHRKILRLVLSVVLIFRTRALKI